MSVHQLSVFGERGSVERAWICCCLNCPDSSYTIHISHTAGCQAKFTHNATLFSNSGELSNMLTQPVKSFFSVTPKFLMHSLELVNLILPVTQLLQNTTALASPALLAEERLLHRRRAAHHDLGVLLRSGRSDLLQEGLSDIPLPEATVTTLVLEAADRIHSLELARVACLVLLELLVQEHVLLAVDAEDERDLGLVLRVVEDALDELVNGCDARAAGDERDRGVLVGRPLVARDAHCEHDAVAGAQGVQVRGLLALGVALHQEVHVAGRVCGRDGCVWPEHW